MSRIRCLLGEYHFSSITVLTTAKVSTISSNDFPYTQLVVAKRRLFVRENLLCTTQSKNERQLRVVFFTATRLIVCASTMEIFILMIAYSLTDSSAICGKHKHTLEFFLCFHLLLLLF